MSILRTDEFAFREIFRTNSRYCMYSFSFETTYEDTSSGSQSRARDVVQLSRRESCPDFVSSNAAFPPCPDEEADLCVHIQFEFCFFSFLSRVCDDTMNRSMYAPKFSSKLSLKRLCVSSITNTFLGTAGGSGLER